MYALSYSGLTLDRADLSDVYMVKYMHADEEGNTPRIKWDATKIYTSRAKTIVASPDTLPSTSGAAMPSGSRMVRVQWELECETVCN